MTFERCNDFQEMFDISREVNGDLVAQGSALLVVQVVCISIIPNRVTTGFQVRFNSIFVLVVVI